MSFTAEIDAFLEKHCVKHILEADLAKVLCARASNVLGVDLSLMSSFGDKWSTTADTKWWLNFYKIKLYLTNKKPSSKIFVFFNGHPKSRVIEVELVKLLEMLNDDDFFHSIFAFDGEMENALLDDHSGFFCGLGYFTDAMQKYC